MRTFDRCRVDRPDLIPVASGAAACWLHDPKSFAIGGDRRLDPPHVSAAGAAR
jgi:hypothetical protein